MGCTWIYGRSARTSGGPRPAPLVRRRPPDTPYRDLGPDHFINRIRKSRQTRRLIGQLTQLGYDVTLEPRTPR